MDLLQIWLTLISVLRLTQTTVSTLSSKCQQMDLMGFMKGRDEIDEVFLASETYTQRYDVEKFKDIKISKLERYGDSEHADKCTWQSGNMYNSTCPHHYVLNTDRKRKPTTIIEARCNCDENQPCLDGIEGSRCRPVKYFIPVLRYNGHRHKCAPFRYSETLEEITVGCTCTYPKLNTDHLDPQYVAPP